MKLIGITGNLGKTTTCEMLYQYLLNKGYSVGLMCSNGVFKDNETIQKNTFNGMLVNKHYELLKDCDYVVTEINEEWSNSKHYDILKEQFECLCAITYHDYICNKHSDIDNFYFRVFSDVDSKIYLCNDKSFYESKTTKTFIEYPIITDVNYNYDNTTFTYNNVSYNTNIFTNFMMIDLSACLGVLNILNEFDSEVLQTTLDNLLIRGRMEKYIINDKNIILDTGWYSLDYILEELDDKIDLNDLEVIIVPFPEDSHANEIVKQRRKETGNYLKSNNLHTILTCTPREQLFKEIYQYENYTYKKNVEESIEESLKTDKKYIFIMGNYQFRKFREYLQELSK